MELVQFNITFHVSFRYLSNTVKNVPVTEGKTTLLNFTLEEPLEEMLMRDPSEQPVVTNEGLNTPRPLTSRSPIHTLDFRYHSYDEMEMSLQLLSAVYPSITYLYSAGRSVLGRNLYVMEISTNPAVDQRGVFAYNHVHIQVHLKNIRISYIY